MPITVEQLLQLADTFDWNAWAAKIRDVIEPGYTAIAVEQGERTADQWDLEWNAGNPFVDRWFTSYLGERITQIDETTRDRIRATLQTALEDGHADSQTDLAARIRAAAGDSAAFTPARARTIARTERAYAVAHGQGLAYRQNGITRVRISDGDYDEACAARDGTIVTVEQWLAEPLLHPNCVADAAPVLDEDAAANEE